MLLTRLPLTYGASTVGSFDLHVLSMPPAFVLSQDQTLKFNPRLSYNPDLVSNLSLALSSD